MEATDIQSHRSKQCVVKQGKKYFASLLLRREHVITNASMSHFFCMYRKMTKSPVGLLLTKEHVHLAGFRVDPFQIYLGSSAADVVRRSPAVGQGYLARAVALESTFERHLTGLALRGVPFQVLSCGAGSDTAFFRLRNMGLLESCLCYFEVDFPQAARQKGRVVVRNPVLADLCLRGSPAHRSSYLQAHDGTCLRIGRYSVIGCDLTKTGDLAERLLAFGMNFSQPTVVLCECSLTYVASARATAFLLWLAASFADARLVVYEQFCPGDRFGTIMKRHFRLRGTPLMNVDDFPALLDQERRLLSVGFRESAAVSLCDLMAWHYGEAELERRRAMEPDYDEFEEFYLKCSHYSILAGKTSSPGDDIPLVGIPIIRTSLPDDARSPAHARTKPCSPLFSRYGHRCFLAEGHLFLAGGISVGRGRDGVLARFSLADLQGEPVQEVALQVSATVFSDYCRWNDSVLCFGGRASPAEASAELRIVSLASGGGTVIECGGRRPVARWRHTLTAVREGSLVLVGGRSRDRVLGDVSVLDTRSWTWREAWAVPGGLHSHSACADDGDRDDRLYVTGGLREDDGVSARVYVWDVRSGEVTSRTLEGLIPRFSHSSCMVGGRLCLVGGVGVIQPGVAVIDTRSWAVREFTLEVPKSVGLYNHALVRQGDKLLLLGGGGNCFSFGMHVATEMLEIEVELL